MQYNVKFGGLKLDNYYGDKYNLDNYYTSESNQGNQSSGKKDNKRKIYKNQNKKVKPTRMKNSKASNIEDKKKNNARKSKAVFVIPAIAFLLVVIIATVGIVVWTQEDSGFVFSKNVSISGIDISGLSRKEAKAKVEENAVNTVEDFRINVSAKGNEQTFTKSDFSYDFDINSALDEAEVYSLKEQGKYEETSYTEFIKLKKPDFKLTYTVNQESISDNVADFAEKVNTDYTNARVKKFNPFEEERFIYEEAKDGYELIQSELIERINQFFTSDETETDIEATVKVVEPEVTVDDLKKDIVGLSSATSVSYNTANGNTNMKVALESCNGSVIEPGELWSFNECTGDSNLESNGYKSATVIVNKKLTEGVGGGLCQASSTIFKAAIFANMGIYERHNHYWASSYAYPGEDATIDYPNLDLKLRNTTEYQMFIECKMEGTTLLVNIYGYQEPSYDNVKIHSENYDVKTGDSYKTITYRTLYLNGEVVKEEVLCKSTYSLTDNASVRASDTGTFRTMVDGTVQVETEPTTATEKPTEKATEKATEKPTQKATETTEKPTKATEKATEKVTEKPTEETAETTEKPTEATETSEIETESQ